VSLGLHQCPPTCQGSHCHWAATVVARARRRGMREAEGENFEARPAFVNPVSWKPRFCDAPLAGKHRPQLMAGTDSDSGLRVGGARVSNAAFKFMHHRPLQRTLVALLMPGMRGRGLLKIRKLAPCWISSHPAMQPPNVTSRAPCPGCCGSAALLLQARRKGLRGPGSRTSWIWWSHTRPRSPHGHAIQNTRPAADWSLAPLCTRCSWRKPSHWQRISKRSW
jgi:hypothetical protein